MDAQLETRLTDAQVAVIGSMLIDDRCVGDVLAQVSAEDFPAGVFRSIFQAMRQLFTAGRPVDPVTVLDAMQGGKELSGCIRQCMDLTPTAANVLEYCKILRELSRVAQLQQIGMGLCSAASLDDAGGMIAKANSLLVERSGVQVYDAEAMMMDFYRRMQSKEKPEYIRCGIEAIDKVMYLELGDMVGIGAAPSTGKTAFALQWAAYLSGKYRVGFYSLETGMGKVSDRLLAQLAQIPLPALKERQISEDDWKRIGGAAAAFSKGHFGFVPASGMTASDIVSTALANHHQVIFVDYLQLVAGSGRQDRYEIVTEASMVFHRAAQRHGILTVVLSQLSRPEKVNGKSRPPDMHSFRESGQIEQDLDVALLLYLDDPDNYRSNRWCKVGKNKEGEKARVELIFDGRYQKFSEVKPNPYAQLKKIANQVRRDHRHGEADDTDLIDPAQVQMQELTEPDKELPF